MAKQKKPASETEKDFFPSRLRELMEEYNSTQEELASAIGVRRQTISLYCNGQSRPDWTVVYRIAKCYEVSSDWLLGLSEYRCKETEETSAKDVGLSEHSVETLKKLVESREYRPHKHLSNNGNVLDAANVLLGTDLGCELLLCISEYLQHKTIPDVRYSLYSDGRVIVSAIDGYLTGIIDAFYDVTLKSKDVLSKMQEESIINLLRDIRADATQEGGSHNGQH